MISTFIQSLSRLYMENKISKEKVDELFNSKKITRLEYEYVIAAGEAARKEM